MVCHCISWCKTQLTHTPRFNSRVGVERGDLDKPANDKYQRGNNKMATSAVGYSLMKKDYGSLYLIGETAANQGIAHEFGVGLAGKYTTSDPTYSVNNEWGALRVDSTGRLMVDTELTLDGNLEISNIHSYATNIADSTTAGYGLIDASGHVQVDVLSFATSLEVEGDVAHDAADSGNPVKVGFKAYAPGALPADVTSGDRVNGIASLNGSQYVYNLYKLDETNDKVQASVAASSVATGASARNVNLSSATPTFDVKITQGNYYGITEINTNTLHNVLAYVQLWDGAVTTGQLMRSYLIPASNGVVGVIADSRFEIIPQSFASGLTIAISSTAQTYTAYAGTGIIYTNISYR